MTTVPCMRRGCGRPLKADSRERRYYGQYGRRCSVRMRQADVQAVLAAVSPRVAAKALALLEDHALVPLNHKAALRRRSYLATSGDGSATYITSPKACGCKAGTFHLRCGHSVAAQILELRSAA
jgi:hypothetical protein